MKPIHWRRTKIGKYLRHLPRPKHIRGTWIHRCCGERLFAPELWHPTRQRFAAGMAVGAFFAMMPPLPFQMLGAALIAYITRVNVPAALAATWISNPFTFPICVYVQYRLGCFLLKREPAQLDMDNIVASLASAPMPYLFGILPSAFLLSIIVYPVTLLIWDWATAGIHASKERRQAKASSHARFVSTDEEIR
jgi:uncharacterized protein (DUF2062 family)